LTTSRDDAEFYLVAVEGPKMGRWIQLGETPIVAGRDPQLAITLSGKDVSRRHLLATVIDGTVIVEDLGSTNGTFVDGQRITDRAALPVGSVLRVGDHFFRCERCGRREMERAVKEQRDLERAANYVQSLLAPALTDGPVRTEWIFQPSARLGGDAFSCDQLDSHTFAIYLFDVCGHGVGAAMHSVSVLNVMRQQALPAVDFRNPVQVLTSLNAMFQMESHDDQYFTMWYGAYDALERTLTYVSAGQHPAYLVAPDGVDVLPLKTPGLMVGAMPDSRFREAATHVPAGSRLYLFSDGIFEIVTKTGPWCLRDFVHLVLQPMNADTGECQRLYGAVKAACHRGQFDDDVSLMVVTFP
jgi:serine phosphatase RsbU (regulator of sigma subunit)